jgi:hypothetical protein
MKTGSRLCKGLGLFGSLVINIVLCQVSSGAAVSPDRGSGVSLEGSFGKLPLYFIENQGQRDAGGGYVVRGGKSTLYLTSQGLTFVLTGSTLPWQGAQVDKASFSSSRAGVGAEETGSLRRWVVKLDFVGANEGVVPEGEGLTPAVVSYFKGPHEQWRTGLRAYGSVIYRDLWPGIDLIYTGTANRLKYSFVVKPGSDPGRIRLAYRGVSSLRVTEGGRLEVRAPMGGFEDDRPVAYQEEAGRKVEVGAEYVVGGEGGEGSLGYGFKLEDYDRDKPLVIDPVVLVYCGYIGESGVERRGIAVDSSGNAYVTGYTASSEATFPVTVGPDLTYNGSYDAFVAKVNPSGTALVYCGYIGGMDNDMGYDIAVDRDGNAYITGNTFSTAATFPVTVGPHLNYSGAGSEEAGDAFVAKVNASGTALVYCGYIGGNGGDIGYGIAVDGSGNAYVTGYTTSSQTTFPVTIGPDITYNGGGYDAFVAKVNASGTALVYCGYIGGSGYEFGYDIAVDGDGNAYVTGITASYQYSFPVTVGPDLTHNGISDAFVAKVNPSGTALVYCGYIGGSGGDIGRGIAVDGDGNAYVTGGTGSSEATFPVTVGPDLTYNGSGTNAFVAKVNASGTALVYCGYIGGDGTGGGIAVDSDGNAYVTGGTGASEATFPVTVGPDLTYNGGYDAFVAKVNASGTALVYCGYIGGSGWDNGWDIAVDGDGNAYVNGYTESSETTFPVTAGPDLTYNGNGAFVAKIREFKLVDDKGMFFIIRNHRGGGAVIHLD